MKTPVLGASSAREQLGTTSTASTRLSVVSLHPAAQTQQHPRISELPCKETPGHVHHVALSGSLQGQPKRRTKTHKDNRQLFLNNQN
jgi:hypothetical protein